MSKNPLNYNVIGEGKTVEETIDDFNKSYEGMRDYYERQGKDFEEIQYDFFYDTASFLDEYPRHSALPAWNA